MNENSGGFVFDDGENFKSNEIGIKEIALEQFRRCAKEGSKNIFNDPAQREVFVNSVKIMELIIIPDALEHDDIKDRISKNEEKISKLERDYLDDVKRISASITDGKKLNKDKLRYEYEKKLIELMQEKLIIIGLLLKRKNYYGEFSLDV